MNSPQVMSLLSPAPPLLPGAPPPDRRATPLPAEGRLRAAPPGNYELLCYHGLAGRLHNSLPNPLT